MSPDWELLLRIVIAALLGGFVGADRERLVWAAGLRTHMLVSVGACLFMIVSAFGFSDVVGPPHISLDPSRVAAQVASGVGILGAGTILLRGQVLHGLTTAASLWSVAAVGLAVGGGLYWEAAAATGLILIVLAGLKPIENYYDKRSRQYEISIIAEHGKLNESTLLELLRPGTIHRYVQQPSGQEGFDAITVGLHGVTGKQADNTVARLNALPFVRQASAPSISTQS